MVNKKSSLKRWLVVSIIPVVAVVILVLTVFQIWDAWNILGRPEKLLVVTSCIIFAVIFGWMPYHLFLKNEGKLSNGKEETKNNL